jgi:predicted RNase H-like HicB family nuclease
MKYAVVIERVDGNFSAYVPDLPGCVTTGRTLEETERNIRAAITLHLEGIREDGQTPPEPTTRVAELEIV